MNPDVFVIVRKAPDGQVTLVCSPAAAALFTWTEDKAELPAWWVDDPVPGGSAEVHLGKVAPPPPGAVTGG